MDPHRCYAYLETSRARLLERVGTLTPERYAQKFEIGPGSLDVVFTHLLLSEWYYVERLEGREVAAYGAAWPYRDEEPLGFAELRSEWAGQAERTKAAFGRVADWGERVSYRITLDTGVTEAVTASKGDVATQLVLHEVHHRAQALNMLRGLGVVLGDLDYNALMYDRRAVGA